MKKIAVTGDLAVGKSTVCRFFKECGAFVVSADELVHALLKPQTDLGKKIIALCGPEVVKDHEFDRQRIAQKAFCDERLLHQLEQILHPEVQKLIEASFHEVSSKQRYLFFVVEIPLLFESNWQSFYDIVVLVKASDSVSRERFSKKTGYDFKEYERRSKRFLPGEEKIERSDFVIINDGSLEDVSLAVRTIYNNLTKN